VAAAAAADLLTCGDCLHEFPLSDIIRFIRHKITHSHPPSCGGRTQSPPADDAPVPAATRDHRAASEGVSSLSPSRGGLVCDSSLPGDEAASASDSRLNGDANDCQRNHRSTSNGTGQLSFLQYAYDIRPQCLQCFDAVGWASGRASGL